MKRLSEKLDWNALRVTLDTVSERYVNTDDSLIGVLLYLKR
jgi:hypothetical protein